MNRDDAGLEPAWLGFKKKRDSIYSCFNSKIAGNERRRLALKTDQPLPG